MENSSPFYLLLNLWLTFLREGGTSRDHLDRKAIACHKEFIFSPLGNSISVYQQDYFVVPSYKLYHLLYRCQRFTFMYVGRLGFMCTT